MTVNSALGLKGADMWMKKPELDLFSGECKDMEECASYCEAAFNWWGAESGYGCVELYYYAGDGYGSCTAYGGNEVVNTGDNLKTILTNTDQTSTYYNYGCEGS